MSEASDHRTQADVSRTQADGSLPQADASRTQSDFIADYNSADYPPFAVTADIAVFTIRSGELAVLLVERGAPPFEGCWALPGGFVGADEDSETAARRELLEETGLDVDRFHFEQLATFADPARDPRMRVVSIAYLVFLPNLPVPKHGDDAAQARFFALRDLTADAPLAFDHEKILALAVERTRAKIEYTPLATMFIEHPFTMGDLRRVFETVWDTALHPANFARKVQSVPGFVREVGRKGASQFPEGRVAKLYEPGDATILHPALLRRDERTAADYEENGL